MTVNSHTLFKIVVIIACVITVWKYPPSDGGGGAGGVAT